MRAAGSRGALESMGWMREQLQDKARNDAVGRLAEIAAELPDQVTRRSRLEAAREVLTDAQFSAVQWAAITIGAFNRLSILSEYPVRERALDRKRRAEARDD
mgnify:CR=1 FL=1